jgi:iron-sulfur cluster repair protein YtfE (RIC family)
VDKLGPIEVLEEVLAEHEILRSMLLRVEVLSRSVLQGRYAASDELKEQVRELGNRFNQHLDREERVLVPALLDADAWGPERVERMHEEHARQREIMSEMWNSGSGGSPNILVFALIAWGFVRMLREDMAEEERISLNPRVLSEDVVTTSVEPE